MEGRERAYAIVRARARERERTHGCTQERQEVDVEQDWSKTLKRVCEKNKVSSAIIYFHPSRSNALSLSLSLSLFVGRAHDTQTCFSPSVLHRAARARGVRVCDLWVRAVYVNDGSARARGRERRRDMRDGDARER